MGQVTHAWERVAHTFLIISLFWAGLTLRSLLRSSHWLVPAQTKKWKKCIRYLLCVWHTEQPYGWRLALTFSHSVWLTHIHFISSLSLDRTDQRSPHKRHSVNGPVQTKRMKWVVHHYFFHSLLIVRHYNNSFDPDINKDKKEIESGGRQ